MSRMHVGGDIDERLLERAKRDGLREESATIYEAFFGRWEGPPGCNSGQGPLGLYVRVNFNGDDKCPIISALRYTDTRDIEEFMRDLEAAEFSDLAGKKVLSYN